MPPHRSSEPEEGASARYGQGAVRVLPRGFVAEALQASGVAREPDARLPKVLLPEHLDHVADAARLLRMGDAVVMKLDRLEESQRQRALDVVTGIACALNARVSKLDGDVHGIHITPDIDGLERLNEQVAEPSVSAPPTEEPVRAAEPARAPKPEPTRKVCALCDQRAAAAEFDSPLEMILRRDGSRDWAPTIGVCARCQRSVRHWRFAVGWCTECERWGRRGVISPCGLVYGA